MTSNCVECNTDTDTYCGTCKVWICDRHSITHSGTFICPGCERSTCFDMGSEESTPNTITCFYCGCIES